MNDLSGSSGGTMIVRPERIDYELGGLTRLFLGSDIHLGATACQVDRFMEDLELANLEDARILLNGDIFDAIVVGDKRYDPSEVHPRLRGSKDQINKVMDWAEELLSPFAHNIDMIGIGNHEDKIIRTGGFNMGLELVRRLNTNNGGKVSYGGYTGFVDYRFVDGSRHSRRFVIHYHHGHTKGSKSSTTISSLEMKRWALADLYWVGHSHQKAHSTQMQIRVPLQGYELIEKEQHFVSTPGYLKAISGQLANGDGSHKKRNYGADAGYIPGGVGGARVNILHGHKDIIEVTL